MSKTRKYRVALMQKEIRDGRTTYSFLQPLPTEEDRAAIQQTYGKVTLGNRKEAERSGIRFSLLSRSIY